MSNAILHLNNISITPKTSTSQLLILFSRLLTRRSGAYRTFKNNTKAAIACKREEAVRYTRDRERHTRSVCVSVCCIYVCVRVRAYAHVYVYHVRVTCYNPRYNSI